MSAGENNFVFDYDPTATRPVLPPGKYDAVCLSVGDGWNRKTDDNGNLKMNESRPLTFTIEGTGGESGEQETIISYLTIGVRYKDKKTGAMKAGDFLLRELIAALGVTEKFQVCASTHDEYRDALKAYVDKNILPLMPGRKFSVLVEIEKSAGRDPRNVISRVLASPEVEALRDAKFGVTKGSSGGNHAPEAAVQGGSKSKKQLVL